MSEEEISLSKQDQLALAIVEGKSINAWARQNDVPRSTAYKWARHPDFRRQVEYCRRRCRDRLLGWTAGHSMRALKGIIELAESAESESVRLRARKFVLQELIAGSKQADLESRMAQIEEKLRARTALANRQP